VGITSETGLVLIAAEQADAAALALLLEAFDATQTHGKELVYRSGTGASLVLSLENLHDFGRLRHQLASRFGAGVALREGIGAVSAIGAGINASYANLRAALRALQEAGTEIRGVSTSSFRISLLIDEARVRDAVVRLHDCLIASR
jgi:aspartate kinase